MFVGRPQMSYCAARLLQVIALLTMIMLRLFANERERLVGMKN